MGTVEDWLCENNITKTGDGVWGVSEKEEYPYPKRYKAPALLYGKRKKMCFVLA